MQRAKLFLVHLHDYVEEWLDVKLVAFVTLEELIVAALLPKVLLQVDESLFDLCEHVGMLKSVLLVLERQHGEIKASLAHHCHKLRPVC